MSVKSKLQIILITYNRKNHLQNTLNQILAQTSPIRDFDITILNNNSTDGTSELIEEHCKKFKNIKHIRNNRNIGGNANIAKAIEIANKQYLWILCDDDKFDFSNWQEVENAINNNEKIICIARYLIPDKFINSIAYQLWQLTFVPSIIYNTELFTDTIVQNVFNNIFTLFPQLYPVLHLINNNGKVYVVKKAIVDNGMDINTTDVSYTRGTDLNDLSRRSASMTWWVGFANACMMIKDIKLRHQIMNTIIIDSYKTEKAFINNMKHYINTAEVDLMQICDVFMAVDLKKKLKLAFVFLKKLIFLKHKEYGYTVIKIFCIRINFKNAKKK